MHARGRLAPAGSDPATGQGIAIARYEPVDERTAEVAVAVDPAWRRAGPATAMVGLLARAALRPILGSASRISTRRGYFAGDRPLAVVSDQSGLGGPAARPERHVRLDLLPQPLVGHPDHGGLGDGRVLVADLLHLARMNAFLRSTPKRKPSPRSPSIPNRPAPCPGSLPRTSIS